MKFLFQQMVGEEENMQLYLYTYDLDHWKMQFRGFYWLSHYGISAISKIQLVVYHQCCVLIG